MNTYPLFWELNAILALYNYSTKTLLLLPGPFFCGCTRYAASRGPPWVSLYVGLALPTSFHMHMTLEVHGQILISKSQRNAQAFRPGDLSRAKPEESTKKGIYDSVDWKLVSVLGSWVRIHEKLSEMITCRSCSDIDISPREIEIEMFTLPLCVTHLKEKTPPSASPQFAGPATPSRTDSWRRTSQTSASLSIWGWKMTAKVRITRRSIYWWTFGWEPTVSECHDCGVKQ